MCADKISNLEDLRNFFERNEKYNFDAFKRGYKEQKWYYISVYESLVTNEDENHSMFVRLKDVVDHIFNDKKNDEYVKNVIFENNIEEYNKLLKLHYRKLVIITSHVIYCMVVDKSNDKRYNFISFVNGGNLWKE